MLEEQFPQPALLPTEDELREEVLRVCGECEDFTNAGLGYMLERKAEDTEEAGTSGRTAKSAFEEQLDKLEKVVAQHGGPYIMGYVSVTSSLPFMHLRTYHCKVLCLKVSC